MPTNALNKYGYAIEFDRQGRYEEFTIDFDAMAAHLKALNIEAEKLGFGIWRVIFDPDLQPFLFKAKDGEYLKAHILIPREKPWVMHDEHYHVDFRVKCELF